MELNLGYLSVNKRLNNYFTGSGNNYTGEE